MTTPTQTDMNRDPITGTPGSHPVGTGVGAAGGAAAGAIAGALFGPIGMLIGGGIGAVAGGAAGHSVAERVDPTGETEYWRNNYESRPYYSKEYGYDDYQPAYTYGQSIREQHPNRDWDNQLEADIKQGWESAKAKSRLTWEQAKDAARDAFDRTDRTHRTYKATDSYWQKNYQSKDYVADGYKFDDYQPAYRYGTYARSHNDGVEWDDRMESKLKSGWERAKGNSRLAWSEAKQAVRDGWHGVERALPGDFDGDGR